MDSLVQWIRVADLDTVDPAEVRALVREALNTLDPEDPTASVLAEIEAALWEGTVPAAALRELAEAWVVEEVSDADALEDEVRRMAAGLPPGEWHTTFYAQALAALEDPALLDPMRARIQEAWDGYSQTPILAEEVTAETTVGHRLLLEGLETWLLALDQLEACAREEMEPAEALATAEVANRLLVAVQKQSRRVMEAP